MTLAFKFAFISSVLLFIPISLSAQWGKHGNVRILPAQNLPKELMNVGAARNIAQSLSFIPHSDNLKWNIVIEDHNAFQNAFGEKAHRYPQRCVTFPRRRETHCDIYFALEFSGMAQVGTLAHEYGHILCGGEERNADRCGAELIHGVPERQIK